MQKYFFDFHVRKLNILLNMSNNTCLMASGCIQMTDGPYQMSGVYMFS